MDCKVMGGDDVSKSVSEAKNKNSSTQETIYGFIRIPRLTVKEAFNDYFGRRSAIVKALTTDVDEFLRQCDPEKDMVCLYGLPDGEWKVEAPVEFVPSELPEPTVGINWGRVHMELHQWLFFVAFQSDAWLISFALHSFAKSRPEREKLFKMINKMSSVTDEVKKFVTTNKEFKFRKNIKNKEAEAMRPMLRTTVEEVFKDFAGRRAAIIKALTTDIEKFVGQISEKEKEVCLYGNVDGEWEVREATNGGIMTCKNRDPTVGINFGREGLTRIQWLRLVAMHSDAWLIATAFHNCSNTHFRKHHRKRLFEMINELPTVVETIGGVPKVESSSKGKEEEEEEEEEEGFCGYCKKKYKNGEFWICCDYCETWYHGQCVGVAPNQGIHIHKFKCSIKCK